MISTFRIKTQGDPNPTKQVNFAAASALTEIVKQAQPAVRKEIRADFTVRTEWDVRGPLAIKIKAASKNPASPDFLTAVIGTAFESLEKFIRADAGRVIVDLPQGRFFAIPTKNARRTKRDLLLKSNRPRALKDTRLLPLKSGKGFVLVQQATKQRAQKANAGSRYPHSRNVLMFILVPVRKIKEKDFLVGPTQRVFEKNFGKVFEQKLVNAFSTAK